MKRAYERTDACIHSYMFIIIVLTPFVLSFTILFRSLGASSEKCVPNLMCHLTVGFVLLLFKYAFFLRSLPFVFSSPPPSFLSPFCWCVFRQTTEKIMKDASEENGKNSFQRKSVISFSAMFFCRSSSFFGLILFCCEFNAVKVLWVKFQNFVSSDLPHMSWCRCCDNCSLVFFSSA